MHSKILRLGLDFLLNKNDMKILEHLENLSRTLKDFFLEKNTDKELRIQRVK